MILGGQLKSTSAALDQLEEELVQMTAERDQESEARQEAEQMIAENLDRLAALEQEIATHAAELNHLRALGLESATTQQDILILREQLVSLNSTTTTLEISLEASSVLNQTLQAEHDQLLDNHKLVIQQLVDARNTVGELEAATVQPTLVQDQGVQHDSHPASAREIDLDLIAGLEQELDQIKDQLRSTAAELDAALAETSALGLQLAGVEGDLQTSQARMAMMTDQVAASVVEVVEGRAQLAALQMAHESVVADFDARSLHHQQQDVTSAAEKQSLEADLEQMQCRVEAQRAELELAKATVSEVSDHRSSFTVSTSSTDQRPLQLDDRATYCD